MLKIVLTPCALVLALAWLSSCNLPVTQPQQGIALDCRHFYRNTAGVWQADGNATVVVNGRRWFLGVQQFTPAGSVVGGQGGELLYDDIQRQCGGDLPVAALTLVPAQSPQAIPFQFTAACTTATGQTSCKDVKSAVAPAGYYVGLIDPTDRMSGNGRYTCAADYSRMLKVPRSISKDGKVARTFIMTAIAEAPTGSTHMPPYSVSCPVRGQFERLP